MRRWLVRALLPIGLLLGLWAIPWSMVYVVNGPPLEVYLCKRCKIWAVHRFPQITCVYFGPLRVAWRP